jgi:hypothetical protein
MASLHETHSPHTQPLMGLTRSLIPTGPRIESQSRQCAIDALGGPRLRSSSCLSAKSPSTSMIANPRSPSRAAKLRRGIRSETFAKRAHLSAVLSRTVLILGTRLDVATEGRFYGRRVRSERRLVEEGKELGGLRYACLLGSEGCARDESPLGESRRGIAPPRQEMHSFRRAVASPAPLEV